jgi:hypothetical protein
MPMNPFSMPLPGALRVRALHPLIDGDGSCSLIYDLERAAVLDVPEELQFHIAPALETGDLDEALVDWMLREDLLTAEGSGSGGEVGESVLPHPADWWHLGEVSRQEGEVHARIEHLAEPALDEALDFVFKQSLGASRVVLHLGWAGAFPGAALLARLTVESRRRAVALRQEVRCELSLDAAALTPAAAAVLAASPFHLRLHCGSFPDLNQAARGHDVRAWRTAEAAVQQCRAFSERTVVQCILAGRARLLDLWTWAREAGVRHLDVLRMEEPLFGSTELARERRDYRGDLHVVCEEMVHDLEEQRVPIDFQPITRLARRLRRRGSSAHLAHWTGGGAPLDLPGLQAMTGTVGDVAAGFAGGDARLLGDSWPDDDELEGDAANPCGSCWARYVCSRSSLVAEAVDAWDRRGPTEERCALWRIEADEALRFYHRLAQVEPLHVLPLFEEAARMPTSPFDRRLPLWSQKSAF